MSGKKKHAAFVQADQSGQYGPLVLDSDTGGGRVSTSAEEERRIKCFMGCTVFLWIVYGVLLVINLGFSIATWKNTTS